MTNVLIGNIVIGSGMVMMLIGLFGFFRFKDFYSKLLVASVIDAMAVTTVLIGVIIRSGLTWFSLKVAVILAIILVLNPVSASKIALSARNNEVVKAEERLAAEAKEKRS